MQTIITSRKRIFLFWVSTFLTFGLAAQSITVEGYVKDAQVDGPLIGVSVMIKGTSTGTVTDVEGFFTLEAPADGALVFSYIGMRPEEVEINGRSTINVTLMEDVVSLSEAVVVGYGVQKKENLSGAVDAIDTEQLKTRPLSNVAQGLQGVSPNLNIQFNSGAPGQAPDINIRGLTSINGGSPLVLIDGVPSDAAELLRIAPEDIANISVLKDASSAAVYGARAAFGVVLITTKIGSQDGVRISYSANVASGVPTVLPDKITDPYIYLRLRETSTDNTPWDNQNYSDDTYAWARERSDNPSTPAVRENPNAPGSWEYMGDRDWTNYFLDNNTTSQNHFITIDGKSNKTQYLLSGSYNRQNGALTLADDFFDRYTARGKVNFQLTDWLSVGNNTLLTATQRDVPSYLIPSNDPTQVDMWRLFNFHPNEWNMNPDGSWANTDVGRMGAQLTNGGTSDNKYNSLQTTFNAEAKFFGDALKLNTDFTTRRGAENWNWYRTRYQVGYGPGDIREEGENTAYRRSTDTEYNVFNIYATFNKQFGQDHQITVLGGFNQEYFREETFTAQRDGLISSSLPSIALATGDAQVSEFIRDWAIQGYFGRINYIFKDRYIIEFNGRYDGSSRFPEDKRFGFFPSGSVAWRVDQENFMAPLENAISRFKLRASYGSLGNQFVTEYGYIPTMSAAQGRYIIGDELPQRITPPALVSPNYTWEDVSTLNFGVDLGLFEDRIIASFDIYRRETKGMLTLGKDLPDVLGASEPLENAADLETKGWEASVEYRNRFNLAGKSAGFNIRAILSDNRSFITKFDNPNQNLTQFYVGQELGEIWGLTNDGFFASEEEIEQLDQTSLIPWGAISIVPGWPRYVDQDGNGVVEKGLTVDDPKDMRVIGNVNPRFQFGLTLGFDWAGFDVNAFFQGVAKQDYYPLDYLYWGFYQQPYAGGYRHLMDFYRATGDSEVDLTKHSQSYIDAGLADANLEATYPHLQAWLADRNLGERIDQSKGLAIPQTDYLLDASYIRFKNLTIGYTLPAVLTEKVGIGSFRIYVSGENLTEWSSIRDFFDPESISDLDYKINPGGSASRTTGKGYAYPFQRRYAVGVNVTF